MADVTDTEVDNAIAAANERTEQLGAGFEAKDTEQQAQVQRVASEAQADKTERERLTRENQRVTTTLASVTAQRDRLLAALRANTAKTEGVMRRYGIPLAVIAAVIALTAVAVHFQPATFGRAKIATQAPGAPLRVFPEVSRLENELAQERRKSKALEEAQAKRGTGAPAIDPALAESLKGELEEIGRSTEAFMACLVLLPVSWCDAGSSERARSWLPPVSYDSPSVLSGSMWQTHADFFARFREIWTTCPGRQLGAGYVAAARWLNENTGWYRRILLECRAQELEDKRPWPPSQAGTGPSKDRFFTWK